MVSLSYSGLKPNKEQAMGIGLRSRVPELLVSKRMDQRTFAAMCMLQGISQDTAYRIARGETEVRTSTLLVVAQVLEVSSIGDLIEIYHDDEDPELVQ